MNIFFLHEDPELCAQMHNDKHVVKMILEYAQLLSTAHRILDGKLVIGVSKTGRKQSLYVLPDNRDYILYNATHINHPSAKWTRNCSHNYTWLYSLFVYLLNEYTYRYGKIHATARLAPWLSNVPKNIDKMTTWVPPWRAMPDDAKIGNDSLLSYRNYYNTYKKDISTWKKREMPDWFQK